MKRHTALLRFLCVAGSLGLATAGCNADTERSSVGAQTSDTDEIAMNTDRSAAIAWIRQNAVPLSSVRPGTGFDDLRPVAPMVADATVVGLGEATHGTREFFQFKHRMLEYLVEEHGYRIFGIEANFPDCLPLNDYVLTGEGDPEALVHGMNFWTWDTEEVLDLVRWMRAYNLEHDEKIFFHGYDAQFAPPGLKVAFDFLDSVGDEKAAEFREGLKDYLPSARPYAEVSIEIYNEPADKKIARHDKALEVLSYFDRNKQRLVDAGGDQEFAVARAAAFSAERAFAMFRPDGPDSEVSALDSFNIRDRAMADLVLWGLDHYAPGSKAVLWAHNGHIQESGFEWAEAKAHVMGMNLDQDLGEKYVSLGFGFGEGGLQARPVWEAADFSDLQPLQEFVVGPAPAATIGGTMAEALPGDFLIDLRRAPAASWFTTPQPMRIAGATYSEQPVDQWGKVALADTFDLFVFVETTTRARPLARTRERFGLAKTW